MSLLDRLERTFGRFAVPNLTLYVIIGQVFVVLGALFGRIDPNWFVLVPARVMQGEWWQLITFLFMPPSPGRFGYLFVVFAWYMLYFFGNSLEATWGTFRFNVFLLIGYVLTVAVAFVAPNSAATNGFLAGSIFLAFARLNPDFTMLLFFILPVKIKWLALITWIGYGLGLVFGTAMTRLMILAAVGNYLLFFASDILLSIRSGQRRMAKQAQDIADKGKPRHTCHVCGKTDISHPDLDFRYCSKCAGDQCYCPEHIQNHAHVVAPENER